MPDRNETIALIKKSLQERSGKTWSVTGGRGTAWGWITISVPPKRLGCAKLHEFNYVKDESDEICSVCGERRHTWKATDFCAKHVCMDVCWKSYITPEDRAELAKLLNKKYIHMQGDNIPSGSCYYEEYIDRAAGRTPTKYGERYWD